MGRKKYIVMMFTLLTAFLLYGCGSRGDAHIYLSGTGLAVLIAFVALYTVLWILFFASKSRYMKQKQKELEQTNESLQHTVNMLNSLRDVYFTMFFVNVAENSYETVFMAPWLSQRIPERGVYTELKDTFVQNMIVEEYRQDVDRRMSLESIRKNLSVDKLTAVRHSFYTDYQAIRGDSVNWCRVTVTVTDHDAYGRPSHILAMLQDISEEKRREEYYQQQIVAEAKAANKANQAKTEFLRRISHDIRTPVNGIQGYINMADRFRNDYEMLVMCKEKVMISLTHLLDIMNNILDMSKLESGGVVIDMKPFDMRHVISEVDEVIRPQAAECGIDYSIHEDYGSAGNVHLLGSPLYLCQILMNVAGNAIKYGHSGGYIRLSVRAAAVHDDIVDYEFVCEDDGIGIGEEFREHIFEPFTQEANDARTHYTGTGLGLSIVKRLLDEMGGTIELKSEKGEGSAFRISIPFKVDTDFRGDNEALNAATDESTMLSGMNVMLVEDNELNMEITEFMLQDRGASVHRAWNGREAVDMFEGSDIGYYDMILMDIMMPVMDGNQAAAAIRALDRPDAAEVPIIAVSANAFDDDVSLSLMSGMNAHVSKPINEKEMFEVIGKFAVKGKSRISASKKILGSMEE